MATNTKHKTKSDGARCPAFTGVAYSTEAAKDQGFNNFRILMLFIVEGEIVHIERSQPYAGFEAVAKIEVFTGASLWNLSSRYKDGAVQGLGGDQRDEIVNRLRKTNPELLRRIAPALPLSPEKLEEILA